METKGTKLCCLSRQEAIDIIDEFYVRFFAEEFNIRTFVLTGNFHLIFTKPPKDWSGKEINDFLLRNQLLDFLFDEGDYDAISVENDMLLTRQESN